MNETEAWFEQARSGNPLAFAEWAGRVERPVRASLARFARAVDLEVVMQETLLRMWLMAARSDKVLTGENASLRMALAVARNVAREELRRAKLDRLVPIDELDDAPELVVEPAPTPDAGLARAIRDCVARLPEPVRIALELRVAEGAMRPDRDLAERLGLKLNTFLQHIVRARKRIADCLRHKGIELAAVWS